MTPMFTDVPPPALRVTKAQLRVGERRRVSQPDGGRRADHAADDSWLQKSLV